MKLYIKTVAVVFTAAMIYACNSSDKTSRSETNPDSLGSDKPAAMDTPHTIIKTETASAEQDFINYFVPKNAREIIWLKAGMAKGFTRDTKEHSAMMLKDHSKLAAEVEKYISGKPGLTKPFVDTTYEINIHDKTGIEWDTAWANKMMDDHNELLDKLNNAKQVVTDADLKMIIINIIPVIESHLAMTKAIQMAETRLSMGKASRNKLKK